ncbi:hypothetical protein RJT34_24139 [Clitoria ternatea]|uniref:Uncharacterized protein n=1 Tax=Clitoria ternatea TaxID=43366 RepID=A0AAN9FMQ3_CLITE
MARRTAEDLTQKLKVIDKSRELVTKATKATNYHAKQLKEEKCDPDGSNGVGKEELESVVKRIVEVELGVKITRTKDDTTSVSNFQFAKDKARLIFLSKETHVMFILTGHLKGYKKEKIDINISKDGNQILVSGGEGDGRNANGTIQERDKDQRV